tara:strand:+ start:825 stop:1634 length:810 start_codon:yes stop_codon:yes gene_type:complete
MSSFRDVLESHTLGELRGLVKKMNVPNYIKVAGHPEKKVPKDELINLIVSHFKLEQGIVKNEKPIDEVLKGTPSKALKERKMSKLILNNINKQVLLEVKGKIGVERRELIDKLTKEKLQIVKNAKNQAREAQKKPTLSKEQEDDKELGSVAIRHLITMNKELNELELLVAKNPTDGTASEKKQSQFVKLIESAIDHFILALDESKKMNKKGIFYPAVIHELGVEGMGLLALVGDEIARDFSKQNWGWKTAFSFVTKSLEKVVIIGERLK